LAKTNHFHNVAEMNFYGGEAPIEPPKDLIGSLNSDRTKKKFSDFRR